MNKVSIIIPVLNEADRIEILLQHLIDNADTHVEVIIVDGGSNDSTRAVIKAFQSKNPRWPLTLMNSEKGRAKQMNQGALHAKGNILYFLHADSLPPKSFDTLIINEVKNSHLAGCFRMQFDSNHWWLQLAGWLTQFNWRACRGGDQSLFITKLLFDTIGGYNESFYIYEDIILINQLYRHKQFTVINSALKTSARLYKTHGVWTVQYHFWAIYLKRWLGASAEELYTYYKKHLI